MHIAEFLIDKGADVDEEFIDGCENGYLEIVKLLVENGAKNLDDGYLVTRNEKIKEYLLDFVNKNS